MKMTCDSLCNRHFWEERGITLPSYDVEAVYKKTKQAPGWVHFGIGNIFRIFIGGIVDGMLEQGILDSGLTCMEAFDFDIVDKIYHPFDNLALSVILKDDGTKEKKILGCFAEAVKAKPSETVSWSRMKEIFAAESLQIVSFTITEKGYALRDSQGEFLKYVKADMENGPDQATGVMGIVTAMLNERYQRGGYPLALVSMDNCSHNGDLLRASVIEMAETWQKKGFVDEGLVDYVKDSNRVAFPWTMIDKITPRPSDEIAKELEVSGIEDMQPVVTGKRTYIAPFINAEKPQYLVIEDSFPNGRPALEKGYGVYMADRETVNKAERMKVTACLNPVHSALGPIGVVLGIDGFADLLDDPVMMKMGKQIAYGESIPVIENPKIIRPIDFTDELFQNRFINKYLGDTNIRLCQEESQGVGVRFGVTINAYVSRYGTASSLVAIPLGLAGWLRYLMAIDDNGNNYELAPDPLADTLHEMLSGIAWGEPSSLTDQLRPILSNKNIFFTDLYEAGLGERIEEFFREMIAGPGSCKNTVYKYINTI
ncbi:MAG: mannitol dehydrogenase family protein [Clostridiales bacterium]|nr:mannitol dehydrogenase family protein [Clostridiales bacterium]